MSNSIIGRIIKRGPYNSYYGFTVNVETPSKAQHYKQIIIKILETDGYNVKPEKGYYDKEN